MKILFLYQNELALKLADLLKDDGNEIILWKKQLELSQLQKIAPDKIISYSYRYIIAKEMIDFMPTSIVNLHISYLPWNRGANPNFWSFIEDTPKGVTIHEIDEKLDRGKILLQRKIEFDEEIETFSTTYDKLNEEIVKLFYEYRNEILNGNIIGKAVTEIGSYHSMADYTRYTQNKGGGKLEHCNSTV